MASVAATSSPAAATAAARDRSARRRTRARGQGPSSTASPERDQAVPEELGVILPGRPRRLAVLHAVHDDDAVPHVQEPADARQQHKQQCSPCDLPARLGRLERKTKRGGERKGRGQVDHGLTRALAKTAKPTTEMIKSAG